MKKEDCKLKSNHKRNIASKVMILILGVVLISYIFKIFGSELFNKFITNDVFIKASQYIDSILWLNILAYGILGFIITLFTICLTSSTLRLKWYEVIIIFAFCLGMSFVRYKWVGAITYLFDFIQYILVPTLYGSIFRKTNIFANLMNTLLMYFVSNGIMLINVTLCDMKAIMYASNFVAYVLCFIEIYLFTIAFSIFIIEGGKKNVKSNVNLEQEERTSARIQKDKK